ncbi:MAG: chlorophyll synthase ChlG [Paracoccaceae bacterium]
MPVNHAISRRSRHAAPRFADPRKRAGGTRLKARVRLARRRMPAPEAVVELLKPVTWFPPMWAFGCGALSTGLSLGDRLGTLAAGLVLAGPVVCAMSQAANDWYDRDVDAVNEPHRPIPSGRVPGTWGFWIAVIWTAIGLALGAALGPWGFGATVVAAALAWAYSAPPLRFKASGWLGPGVCGLAYEGLPWVAAAAILTGGAPRWEIWLVAGLYALGAHGIMTLNDFKAIEGDRAHGLRSLPVTLGPERAAKLACAVMAGPQLAVVALLALWGAALHASLVAALLVVQLAMMPRLLEDPRGRAPWYNGVGVGPYVLGMATASHAIGWVIP